MHLMSIIVVCSASGLSIITIGPKTMQSTPITNIPVPNFAQPEVGLRAFTGCFMLHPNCAPQFVQNPDADDMYTPQYEHGVGKGPPHPSQNRWPK